MFDYLTVRQLEKNLISEINVSYTGLLTDMPIEAYVEKINNVSKIGSYHRFGPEVEEFCARLIGIYEQSGLEMYHKLALIRFIINAEDELYRLKMPMDIITLFHKNFKRIIKRVESKFIRRGFFLFSNDKFCKDLSVCRLSMIPAGQQKIHLDGIARRLVVKSGVLQFAKLSSFVLFELGGFRPLYHMHTDNSDRDLLAEFTFEGTKRFYLRISELLKLYPKIKGVFGMSWMNDPQLAQISPKLWMGVGYVVENGARLFNLGSNDSAVRDATYASIKRKQLYEAGEYLPTNYLLVWSREKVIALADSIKSNSICYTWL